MSEMWVQDSWRAEGRVGIQCQDGNVEEEEEKVGWRKRRRKEEKKSKIPGLRKDCRQIKLGLLPRPKHH